MPTTAVVAGRLWRRPGRRSIFNGASTCAPAALWLRTCAPAALWPTPHSCVFRVSKVVHLTHSSSPTGLQEEGNSHSSATAHKALA